MLDPQPASARRFLLRDALVAALAVGAAVLAIAVWRQRAEIRRLAAANAQFGDPGAVGLRTARARRLALVPPRAAAAMPDQVRSAEDTAEAAAPVVARDATARSAPAGALARLLNNPEFFQLLGLHRQSALDARFGALFRRLALDASELVAFKRLLAEKENVALDVVAVSDAQPDGPLSAEEIGASVDAARAQVENAIRTSLGSERYAVYRDYEQTLPQRTLVAQLEQRLSYSAAPLTPAQSEAVVRILVARAPAPPAEAAAPAAVMVGKGAPAAVPLLQTDPPAARVTDAAIVDAQAVLTPHQVAALRDLQTEQQATARAMQLLHDNLPAGDPRPGVLRQLFLQ